MNPAANTYNNTVCVTKWSTTGDWFQLQPSMWQGNEQPSPQMSVLFYWQTERTKQWVILGKPKPLWSIMDDNKDLWHFLLPVTSGYFVFSANFCALFSFQKEMNSCWDPKLSVAFIPHSCIPHLEISCLTVGMLSGDSLLGRPPAVALSSCFEKTGFSNILFSSSGE